MIMLKEPTSERVIAGLNLILTTLRQSLTMYLADSSPWIAGDTSNKLATLRSIVADQRRLIDELGTAIIARNGVAGRMGFPTEFTGMNDLSFDYLVQQAAEKYVKRDLQVIQRAVDQLEGDAEALELGQRVVGATKAHLDMLENC